MIHIKTLPILILIISNNTLFNLLLEKVINGEVYNHHTILREEAKLIINDLSSIFDYKEPEILPVINDEYLDVYLTESEILNYDKNSKEIDGSDFKKTVENSKISFNLFTTKEVSVVLMPRYADEVNKNHYGKSVKLSLSGNGEPTKEGGLEMKVKLKGTATALEKYSEQKRVVYTEDTDVSGIYQSKTFDKVKAAELSNSVWYVDAPQVKVKATVDDK